jgi:predicted CxxxxCH...CXXCH cytochrome family protein
MTTAGGTFVTHPLYNTSTGGCAATYCHGNWMRRKANASSKGMFTDTVMVGNAFAPKWTNGAVDGACGTCHDIPPKGHLAVDITSCAACHGEVVDGTGKIIDKSKHINGKINVGGLELPF